MFNILLTTLPLGNSILVSSFYNLDNMLHTRYCRRTQSIQRDSLVHLEGFPFAGPGQSHLSDSSTTTILMADQRTNLLIIKDLVGSRFYQSLALLASLSARLTADNKEVELLDVTIVSINACQLVELRHVIELLCEVSDKNCVDAAQDLYNSMNKAKMSEVSISQGPHVLF
jgi:hypothetical protein